MPNYLVRKDDDTPLEEAHVWEVQCSYEELKEMCSEYGIKQVMQAPSMISDHKSPLTRAGSEWNNMLTKMKKNAGYRVKNTIND